MKRYLLLLTILLFFTGCIYETPQAKQISQNSYNSTSGTFTKQQAQDSKTIQKFEIKSGYESAYTLKSVENFYDECDGCMDYVSASAAGMRKFDSSLTYPFIVSISGALSLSDKDSSVSEFLGERIKNYGFEAFFASSADTSPQLSNFYVKYKIKNTFLHGLGDLPYLKLVIYSGAVPIVTLDRYYLFQEQSFRYSNLTFNYSQKNQVIFAIVPGYDTEKMLISDPTVEGLKANYQSAEISNFTNGWENTNSSYGPRFVFYLVRQDVPVSNLQAMELIKKDIIKSHGNLQNYMSGKVSSDFLGRIILQGYTTRKLLAEYLKEDNPGLSNQFKESSNKFKSIIAEKDINTIYKVFDDIINLEKTG
jgi:hypothetical protein